MPTELQGISVGDVVVVPSNLSPINFQGEVIGGDRFSDHYGVLDIIGTDVAKAIVVLIEVEPQYTFGKDHPAAYRPMFPAEQAKIMSHRDVLFYRREGRSIEWIKNLHL